VIRKSLASMIPSELLDNLPDKWEKIGSVVTIKLPKSLCSFKTVIGEQYALVLECSTVLNDVGGISGVFRQPQVEIVYGSPDTETVHVENGIRYKLDPMKIMFSSGNMAERKRMGTAIYPGEVIVDLFAGIGYFTLPMAVYGHPKKIVACEVNPVAYQYLCTNLVLNHVTGVVEAVLGDNRVVAPKDCADRVVLGYLEETQRFLPVAFECLKTAGGVLHYHCTAPDKMIPKQPLQSLETVAEEYHRTVELLMYHLIKSYAPGISHVVLDVKVGAE